MAHNWERCHKLAVQLIKTSADYSCPPGTIRMVDVHVAASHLAGMMVQLGIPAPQVATAMRSAADAIEMLADCEARHRRARLVVVSGGEPEPEPEL